MATFDNNLFIGKVLTTLEVVDSTNNYAKGLLSKSKPLDGTAIIAYAQSHGRGQIGNTWFSEPGKNLTLSIILYPHFLKASEQFTLTQAVALAIADSVGKILYKPVKIKWPNDIYCMEKKLAGILVENTIAGQNLTDSVVGIGLNVNQTNFNGLLTATSLQSLMGMELRLEEVRDHLFAHLEKRYLQMKNGHRDILNNDYHAALYRRNEWHTYKGATGNFEGKIVGVNGYGQLQVETASGVKTFNNKEIEWVH